VRWLTTLPPLRADCLAIWEPEAPGTLRACPGLYRDSFAFCATTAHIDNVIRGYTTLVYTARMSTMCTRVHMFQNVVIRVVRTFRQLVATSVFSRPTVGILLQLYTKAS
jgi:hypothetical protein